MKKNAVAALSEKEFVIQGTNYWPKTVLALWYMDDDRFQYHKALCERYKAILIEKGTGVLGIGKERVGIGENMLLLLNETEWPDVREKHKLQARSLYFHPCVLNKGISFENILQEDLNGLPQTVKQDKYYFEPFARSRLGERIFYLSEATALRLGELFQSLEHEVQAQDNNFWPCRSRQFLTEILFLILRICQQPLKAAPMAVTDGEDVFDKVVMFLHARYGEKLSLKRIADEFHTNRTSLNKIFKGRFGSSVFHYLVRLRVQIAASLLAHTKLPVAQILYRVGFRDASHFSRMFKRVMGFAPSKYREKHTVYDKYTS